MELKTRTYYISPGSGKIIQQEISHTLAAETLVYTGTASQTTIVEQGLWANVPTVGLVNNQIYYDTYLKKMYYYNLASNLWFDSNGIIHP
jgi:hypothetical protein